MKRGMDNEWCKRANIAMVINEKDTGDIAEDLGYTKHFVCGIINGYRTSSIAKLRISNYLGIKADPDKNTLKVIKSILENDGYKEISM